MKKALFIKLPYWIGITLDAIIGLLLLVPPFYDQTIGQGYALDFRGQLNTSVAGLFIFSWTFLLIWALNKPVDRRFIGLLTAVPILLGLVIINTISYLNGNMLGLFFVIKLSIVLLLFLYSYYLAAQLAS